jgi:hypothetical protein
MEGSYVVFSRPVGGIPAGEPIRVTPENAHILEQAARQGLEYEKVGDAWSQRTRYIPSGGRRGGFSPVHS